MTDCPNNGIISENAVVGQEVDKYELPSSRLSLACRLGRSLHECHWHSATSPRVCFWREAMRIISGSKRGKKLTALEGEQVRPTTDRVKEALFDILQFSIEGRRFLDLFAGSGQMGLEALSRGASQAVFVDVFRDSIRVVEKNVAATGFSDRAKIVQADFAAYLRREREAFDIAFLDPPYRTGLLQKALPLVTEHMNPGGAIFCEHPADEELPEQAGEFAKRKTYRYGRIMLTSYRIPQL